MTLPAGPGPKVLYDANLLYPFHLRNFLVQLGVHSLVRPRWTDAIHDEWIRNLATTGRVTRERLVQTRDIMKRVLPEADIRGYEHRIAGLILPDAGDRHVLAAAIEGQVDILLTFNLRHFPKNILVPFGLRAMNPDGFLCELHAADPEAMAGVVDAARLNLGQSTPDASAFTAILARQGLVRFAAILAVDQTT